MTVAPNVVPVTPGPTSFQASTVAPEPQGAFSFTGPAAANFPRENMYLCVGCCNMFVNEFMPRHDQ
jgi:hypothetical protein